MGIDTATEYVVTWSNRHGAGTRTFLAGDLYFARKYYLSLGEQVTAKVWAQFADGSQKLLHAIEGA